MSEVPQWSILIIFALGCMTGVIAASLFYEIRRRESRSQRTTGKSVRTEVKEQVEADQAQQSSPVQPVIKAEILPVENPLAAPAQSETSRWVSGALEPVPEKVSLNPLDALIHGVQVSTVKEKPRQMNMAEEIDEILQEKLVHSQLAGRTIQLRALVDGSLDVIVDGAHYKGVGEVVDPAARQLIQLAVTEWQHRSFHRNI